jgi:hypothetical protein
MSHKPPEPTSVELKRWGRLASCAILCGEQPGIATGDLAEAARLARKSCVPGVLNHENPFVRLQKAAVRFCEATTAQRRDLAESLGVLGDECRQRLAVTHGSGPPSDPPPRRERADIDG